MSRYVFESCRYGYLCMCMCMLSMCPPGPFNCSVNCQCMLVSHKSIFVYESVSKKNKIILMATTNLFPVVFVQFRAVVPLISLLSSAPPSNGIQTNPIQNHAEHTTLSHTPHTLLNFELMLDHRHRIIVVSVAVVCSGIKSKPATLQHNILEYQTPRPLAHCSKSCIGFVM